MSTKQIVHTHNSRATIDQHKHFTIAPSKSHLQQQHQPQHPLHIPQEQIRTTAAHTRDISEHETRGTKGRQIGIDGTVTGSVIKPY